MNKKVKVSKLRDYQVTPVELASVLAGIVVVDPVWDRKITGVCQDSRCVATGDLFIACKGEQHDARLYIHQAIEKGAVAVIAEADDIEQTVTVINEVPVFYTTDLLTKVGKLAARFYGHPSRQIQLIGVTGTNGKTSTTHFIANALSQCELPCGLIGTLGYGLVGQLTMPTHTTPAVTKILHVLATCRDSGVEHVAMEVSSHALA